MTISRSPIFLFFTLISLCGYAQETVVSGRIFEKGKQEPIPFASIGFKGTTTGTTSDFEGTFSFKTSADVDSIIITCVGYNRLAKAIKKGQKQYLHIELESSSLMMKEVFIKPGVNPALRIINLARERRAVNDPDQLVSYEYDCYNKVDVSMNNISEKMKNNKLLAPLKSLFDTTNQMKNEEGKYILPVFISETQSHYYYNSNPSKSKEVINASNITGFGVNEGSFVVDLLGTSLIQFNFNHNWMRILAKDFISPLATGSHSYYYYKLVDSTFIEGKKCYEIKLDLKRKEDLGFLGTVWIEDSTFAIRRINAEISPNANLNFIERLKIQQEQAPTAEGPWLPVKTRVIVEIGRVTENTSGFVAKMYRANTKIVVNKPKDMAFFDVVITHEDAVSQKDSAFWAATRTETFSAVEQKMFSMIDSVKNLPAVRTYIDIVRLITEGYYRKGAIDYGPYLFLVGYNEVEGFRTRIGFRTNQQFSRNWYYRGYLAYGFRDQKLKYGLGAERILSHRKWTTLGIHYKNDNDILGVSDPSSAPIFAFGAGRGNLFAALSLSSGQSRINHTIDYRLVYLTQPLRDWTFRVSLQNTFFEPLGKFVFAYKRDPVGGENKVNLAESFTYTAATVDVRFAFKEVMIARGNERLRMTMPKAPSITLSYTRGFKGVLSGNFNFDKVQVNMNQHITTGALGNADYSVTVGKLYGRLPYPMLEVMRGNSTFIYSDNNFSLMNLFEFVADEYSHFWYVQHFEGLFFNRVPLFRKWKLRNFAVVKAAYGHLSARNNALIPSADEDGKSLSPIYQFRNEPYVEAGYGIENIFRFVSIGAVHRLTYLNNVNVRKWGINVGINITF